MMTPLDILFLDDEEQQVVSCVTRRPQASLNWIAVATGIACDELERLLNRLVKQARLIEEKAAGQSVYSVRYGRVTKGPKNMPSRLDLFG